VKTVQLPDAAVGASIRGAVRDAFSAKLGNILESGWRVLRVKAPMKKTRKGDLVPRKGVGSRLRPLNYEGELTMEHIRLCVPPSSFIMWSSC
jgi:hypothetical protein